MFSAIHTYVSNWMSAHSGLVIILFIVIVVVIVGWVEPYLYEKGMDREDAARMKELSERYGPETEEMNERLALQREGERRREEATLLAERKRLEAWVEDAEREVEAKYSGTAPPAAAPHLTDAQLEAVAVKALSRISSLPALEQAKAWDEWGREMGQLFPPLVAAELTETAAKLRGLAGP